MMSRYGLTHPAADQLEAVVPVEEKPETVKTHDACDVTLVPVPTGTGPGVAEAFKFIKRPALGRFVV
jgi:hypothetical protein